MRELGLALSAAKMAAMMEAQAMFAQSMRLAEGLPAAPRRYRRRTTLHITNGKRECARRRRQIAAGSLRIERVDRNPHIFGRVHGQ